MSDAVIFTLSLGLLYDKNRVSDYRRMDRFRVQLCVNKVSTPSEGKGTLNPVLRREGMGSPSGVEGRLVPPPKRCMAVRSAPLFLRSPSLPYSVHTGDSVRPGPT